MNNNNQANIINQYITQYFTNCTVIVGNDELHIKCNADTTISDIKETVANELNLKKHVQDYSVFNSEKKLIDSPENVKYANYSMEEQTHELPNWANYKTYASVVEAIAKVGFPKIPTRFYILDSCILFDIFLRNVSYDFGDAALIVTDRVVKETRVQSSFLKEQKIIHLANIVDERRSLSFAKKLMGIFENEIDDPKNSFSDFIIYFEGCAAFHYLLKYLKNNVEGTNEEKLEERISFLTRNQKFISQIQKQNFSNVFPIKPVEIKNLKEKYNYRGTIDDNQFQLLRKIFGNAKSFKEFHKLIIHYFLDPTKTHPQDTRGQDTMEIKTRYPRISISKKRKREEEKEKKEETPKRKRRKLRRFIIKEEKEEKSVKQERKE